MRIKDKIISFILILMILALVGIIGFFGFAIYSEIMGESESTILDFIEDYRYTATDREEKQESGNIIDTTLIYGGENGSNATSNVGSDTRYRNLYNQLDQYAKIIYNKLYENRENLKTGTYTVEFGNAFSDLLSKENGSDELQKQYQSAIEVLIYENPEIFYIDATHMFLNIEKITKITGVKYNVYINNGSSSSYLAEGFFSKEQIDQAQAQIEAVRDSIVVQLNGRSDYDKIKLIHDYLIDSIEYDTSLEEEHIYNVYGALINKKCVCEGYAKAYQYLLNAVEIDNAIVIGTATNSKNDTENHAWNYVKLNGNWYSVDVTWDDPIIMGGGTLTKRLKYQNFLKGSKTLNENHIAVGNFTDKGQIFTYPTLSLEDYE